MNWITHLLKNKSGKLAKGPLIGGVITLGAMGLTLGGYQHDVAKYEGPDRAVTMGYGPDYANMSTMSRDAKGELTAMPAYLQGRGGTDGIRFGRQQDQFNNPVSENFDAGVAAQFGGMDGLSQGGAEGGFDRIQPAARASVDASQGNNYNMGSLPAGRSAGAVGSSAGERGGSFSRASAPQSSGSESLSASGSIGGGRASAPAAGGSRGGSNGGNYELTASMPTSSSMAALTRANAGSRASFGGQRDVHSRKGQRIKGGGNLKDIADTTSQIARKGTDAGANAGAKPFLNGGMVGGGVTFGDGKVGAGASGNSNDFNSISTDKIQSNLQKKNDELQDDLEKERRARKQLLIKIIALIAAVAGLAYAMYSLITKGRALQRQAQMEQAIANMLTAPYLAAEKARREALAKSLWAKGKALMVAGWACLGVGATAAAYVTQQSFKFASDYQWGIVPLIGAVMGVASIGALTYVGIRAMSDSKWGADPQKSLKMQLQTLIEKEAPKLAASLGKQAVAKGASKLGGSLFK